MSGRHFSRRIPSWQAKVFNHKIKRRRRGTRRTALANRRVLIEELESRHLLAVVSSIENGVLDIAAGDGNDKIILAANSAGNVVNKFARTDDADQGIELLDQNSNQPFAVGGVMAITVRGSKDGNEIDLTGVTGVDFEDSLQINIIGYVNPEDPNAGHARDEIYGSKDFANYIDGGEGDDIIHGGDVADVIHGGDGADQIDGGEGDDKIFGGADASNIDGGEGNDTIEGGSANDSIDGGEGDDIIMGFDANDTIDGGEGDDILDGGLGGDRYLYTGVNDPAADTIVEGSIHDDVDTFDFSSRTAGVALDLRSVPEIEEFVGSLHDDSFSGISESNFVAGGGGDDNYRFADIDHGFDTAGEGPLLAASTVADLIANTIDEGPGQGTDTLDFSANESWIALDFLDAHEFEQVIGTDFDDTFFSSGQRVLIGGDGNDSYDFYGSSGLASATIVEHPGQGRDRLSFVEAGSGIVVDLRDYPNIEDVQGSRFADVITGNDLENYISGRGGSDWIEGRAGIDTLAGGEHADTYSIIAGEVLHATDMIIDDDAYKIQWPDGTVVDVPFIQVGPYPFHDGTAVVLATVSDEDTPIEDLTVDAIGIPSQDITVSPSGEVIWAKNPEDLETTFEIDIVVTDDTSMSATKTVAFVDSDGDGLQDVREQALGTNPESFDTDGDLLGDKFEHDSGLDPIDEDENDNQVGDQEDDFDGDGLSNFAEQIFGTDPTSDDSDGDGTSDGEEVGQGGDPNDPADNGVAPDEDKLVVINLIVGDESSSHSERWELQVGSIHHQAPEFGVTSEWTPYIFEKGKTYDIKLNHLGSEYSPPDHDWYGDIGLAGGQEDMVIVEDPPFQAADGDTLHLLGSPGTAQQENIHDNVNDAIGRKGYLHIPLVDLDLIDSSGNELPDQDPNEEVNPGGFVVLNNDDDNGDGIPDYVDGQTGFDDDDLIELKLHRLVPIALAQLPGEFRLSFDSTRVRIFKDRSKNEEVVSDSTALELDSDHMLYVEGIAVSDSLRDEEITATYLPGSLGSDFKIHGGYAADQVNVTVFGGDLSIENDQGIELSQIEEDNPGGFVLLNDDDDDLNFVADMDQVEAVLGEDDLLKLNLRSIQPNAMGGQYALKFGSDAVKIWRNVDRTDLVTSEGFIFDASSDHVVYVEGLIEDSAIIELLWSNSGTSPIAMDRVKVTVVGFGLDIDSDNSSQFAAPSQNQEEGNIEWLPLDPIPETPGKIILIAQGDADSDGIPDHLDGYNDDLVPDTDDDQSGAQFVPIKLAIPPFVPIDSSATLTIEYPENIPGLTSGRLRIWTKDGTESRDARDIRWNEDGDFVGSGSYTEAELSRLGFSESVREQTLYVEAIDHSFSLRDLEISATFNYGGMVFEDKVQLTAIEAIDLRIDNISDEWEEEPGAIIWLNSDFSKQVPDPDDPNEPGLPRYLPDYRAVEQGLGDTIDPNFASEFTPATLVFPALSEDGFKIDFPADQLDLWTQSDWPGFEPAADDWFRIRPGDLITPMAETLDFWIEGLNPGGISFGSQRIRVFSGSSTSPSVASVTAGWDVDPWKDNAHYTVVDTTIAVDGNRDGTVEHTNSHDRQLTFWYNNDRDGWDEDEEYQTEITDFGPPIDFLGAHIDAERDLEDFAHLQLKLDPPLLDTNRVFDTATPIGEPADNQLKATYTVSFKDSATDARINLYLISTADPIAHVSDRQVMNTVLNFSVASDVGEEPSTQLNLTGSNGNEPGTFSYLFEANGTEAESSTLVFTSKIEYPDGSTTERDRELKLNLHEFEDFYNQRDIEFDIGGGDLRQDPDFTHFADAESIHNSQVSDVPFLRGDDNLILVHGWNMRSVDKNAFAETAFKRLYWQGFQGDFYAFNWPTFYDAEGPRWVPGAEEGVNVTYNPSEFQAYRSGRALRHLITGLNGDTHLLAHSMGNVVAAEALRQSHVETPGSSLVKSYVAMEAAISAGAYQAQAPTNDDAFVFDLEGFNTTNLDAFEGVRTDLNRNWSSGLDSSSDLVYMVGTKTTAEKWINLHNAHDIATGNLWKLNNFIKPLIAREEVGNFDLNLGELAETVLDLGFQLMFSADFDSVSDAQLLPPTEIWQSRYVAEFDPVQGAFRYYRIPYDDGDGLNVDRSEWEELTTDLVDAMGRPGSRAYEIIAFTAQNHAATVGTKFVPWFDSNVDIFGSGMLNGAAMDPRDRAQHSVQFHHDAEMTWNFYDRIKTETNFQASH